MTRSVTIVNTSNWANEDYIIYRERGVNLGEPAVGTSPILKPGESYQYTPYEGVKEKVSIDASTERGKPMPFNKPELKEGKLVEKQVTLNVTVTFE